MSLASPRLHSLAPTLVTLPSMSLIPSAPLKLVRCPHSLAPTLVALPSMSLIPSAPFPICGNGRQCARCNREKILLRRSSLRSRFGGVGGYGGTSVVVQTPTGSGKTYIFELLYSNLKTQAVFTVPTRAGPTRIHALHPKLRRSPMMHHKRLTIS
jgi:hypothetical protein